MLLALRCARDSMPQLRLEILIEIATNPRSRVVDVSLGVDWHSELPGKLRHFCYSQLIQAMSPAV
jgi:hypothetical protein